jgi:[NiFe] hydrogenase assembly HybE family chaperone
MSFLIHTENPAKRIEEAFSRVQRERMADVPILNTALSVEAVDFQRWQGHWLGMLVTPWFLSILLLPGKSEDWESIGHNRRRSIRFPAGEVTFVGNEDVGLGEFLSCSLFSPMDQFTRQDEAVITARASLSTLLQGDAPEVAAKSEAPVSSARRRFFAPFLRGSTGQ